MSNALAFSRYATPDTIERRIQKQGYYDYARVHKNFDKAFNALGSLDKNDLCCAITLRLKNQTNGKKTYWGTCDSVANALRFKVSAKYWGRKGRKHHHIKMPMVRAIEPHKDWFKEHLHIIIRFKDLKHSYSENEIESFIRETCRSFK